MLSSVADFKFQDPPHAYQLVFLNIFDLAVVLLSQDYMSTILRVDQAASVVFGFRFCTQKWSEPVEMRLYFTPIMS